MNAERHHLIYLNPCAEFSIASVHEDKKAIERGVITWIAKELPCIYAKQVPHEEAAHLMVQSSRSINLGVSLLCGNKKHRVSLRVAPSAVQKQQLLPQLMEMQDFFLHDYGIEFSGLPMRDHISNIAVYGSFLFHYLSGQHFVNEASDLDLLFNYQGYSLAQLNELITVLTKKFKRTIDGEVRFSLLGDVPVRELLNLSAKKLLCKRRDKVVLLSRAELYEYYSLL